MRCFMANCWDDTSEPKAKSPPKVRTTFQPSIFRGGACFVYGPPTTLPRHTPRFFSLLRVLQRDEAYNLNLSDTRVTTIASRKYPITTSHPTRILPENE